MTTRPQGTLALMRAGLTRRQLVRTLGASAASLSMSGLLVACAEDETDDSAGAASNDGEDESDPTADTDADDEDDPGQNADESDDEGDASVSTDGDRLDLVVAVQGLPGNFDPHQNISNVGNRVTYSVFDHLIENDFRDGDPPGSGSGLLPMLATDWERVDDLTLELNLREDVLFHNGDALTAEDVKFSFDRVIIDTPAELQSALNAIATIESVEVVDEYTIRIITEAPDPILEMRISGVGTWIIPKTYYEEVGMDGFANEPVGTGPYRFAEMQADERLVFEAFDDYWDGPPAASTVTFNVIPETATRISAFVSGETDITTNVPPDQVATIESAEGVDLRSIPLANCHVLIFNAHHHVLQDKRLRQALRLGIDRELLIETLWGGDAVHTRSHQFPVYGSLYNPDRPYTEYDPDRARELVEESDYDGSQIIYSVHPTYYTLGLEAAQAIAEMWAELGLNVELDVREDVFSLPEDEVMVRQWSNGIFPADPDRAFWQSWGTDSPPQQNFWTPENERFNELGEESRRTLDEDLRYDLYQEMLDIWEDETPGTLLYIPVEHYGVRDGVEWLPYSFWYMDLRPDNFWFEE